MNATNKQRYGCLSSRCKWLPNSDVKLASRLVRFVPFLGLTFAILLTQSSSASCIPFDQARNHLGETQCVTGKVIRVKEGNRGVRFLDFCEDYHLCTFTVVVFPYDLKKIGDVRELAGKMIEIRGEVKEYD